jgi:hypothetical protein
MREPIRVVTAHSEDGNATVGIVGRPPIVQELAAVSGTVFYEMWNTATTPAVIDNGADVTLKPLQLRPVAHGSVFRIVDIPPDSSQLLKQDSDKTRSAFAQIGDAAAATGSVDAKHPLMHRTETVDYGIVIEGQITLILDSDEVTLNSGDVVIQRGTNHAWANRSGVMARMAFVLLDGRYDQTVRSAIDKGSK